MKINLFSKSMDKLVFEILIEIFVDKHFSINFVNKICRKSRIFIAGGFIR